MTDSSTKSGLSEENLHCAHLAIITLENALKMLQ